MVCNLSKRFICDVLDSKDWLLKCEENNERYAIPETSIYNYYQVRGHVKIMSKKTEKKKFFIKNIFSIS